MDMNLKKVKLAGAVVLLASSLAAESINPPTNPQTAPMTAKEKKNLQFALDFTREVLQARHTDLSLKYQAEDYIQHNPNVPTGRAAFIAFFSRRPPVNPIPAKLDPAPVVAGAKGDYVWMIMEREDKDPRDPSKTYHYNTFDVYRLGKGKIRNIGIARRGILRRRARARPIPYRSRRQANKAALARYRRPKKNIGIATMELKDMLQYGHLELADKVMDPSYVQHNPNVPQGRDGFKQFMARVPGRKRRRSSRNGKPRPC